MGRGWKVLEMKATLVPLWRWTGDFELALVSRGLGPSISGGSSPRAVTPA